MWEMFLARAIETLKQNWDSSKGAREEDARERKRIADLEAVQRRKERESKLSRQWSNVDSLIDRHSEILRKKREVMITTDDYGVVDKGKWEDEKKYFLDKVIYPSTNNDTLLMKSQDIINRIDTIPDQLYGNL